VPMRRWLLHGGFGLVLAVTLGVAAFTLRLAGVPAASAAPARAGSGVAEDAEDGGSANGEAEASWRQAVVEPPTATRVDAVGLEVWAARELTLRDGAAAGLGVAFPRIAPGALLAVVSFDAPWTDYRGQRVAPGRYLLRYAVQPEDGYHVGLTFYRDFALLLPPGEAPVAPVVGDEAALVEASRPASGHHPAVLALWPADGRAPDERFDNDLGQPVLVLAVGEERVGLVLAGTGEIEE